MYNENCSITDLIEGRGDGPSAAYFSAIYMRDLLADNPAARDEEILWATAQYKGLVESDPSGEEPDEPAHWLADVLAYVRQHPGFVSAYGA